MNEAEFYVSDFDNFLNKIVFALIRKFNQENNNFYSFYKNQNNVEDLGLPLTLNASKVLANFHLKEFDEDIVKNVKPLYYGRYVDDFIIAVEKTSNSQIDLRSILRGLKSHTIDGENKILCSKFIQNGEKISLGIFNPDKEKIFSFNYEKDKGEIDHLKKAINKNSSEWKLIPDISEYDEINSSGFFNDTNKDCEEVDSLRKSTGLSIKRNHFVRQILAFENNINSLDKFYWEDRLDKFLNLIIEYVFDLKNFIDLSKFIPRLFGIVIHSKSTEIQLQFFQKFEEVLKFLSIINKSIEVDIANRYLQNKTVECIICSLPLDFEGEDSSITSFLSNFFNKHFFDESDLNNSILDYFNADLHRIPYKDCYFKYDEYVKYLNSNIENLHEEIIEYKFFKLKTLEFIAANLESTQCGCEHEHCEIECRLITQSSGFFFFTRRISLLELTIAFKNKVLTNYEDFISLAESYYYKVNLNIDASKNKFFIDFDKKNFLKDNVKNPMIANTHFMTHESSFDSNVRNINDVDVERPDKLKQIVNDVINCKKKVDYLVFHELALPRNLYVQLASKLSFAGINLVAGLEYKINRDTLSADNQLVYILKNLNGTANQSIAVFQSKLVGAVEETVIIRNKANLKIIPQFTEKLIIKHSGFVFSGLICNDLLYIKNRSDLAGDIDNLFIVTWNKDIETYENLVKSTCLDLHSFITLCNNREYGDTRIRGPYKDSWRRDLMKIHGGMLDTFVLSELDIKALRNFQTNEMPPKDPFKPFPIGFKISNERRLI